MTAGDAGPAPGRTPRLSLNQLRAAVARAAEVTSYRKVAKAVGLSARAVQLFAEGANVPRARTVERVRAWEARHRAGVEHAAVAVIETLLAPLPHVAQATGAAAIAAVVVELYQSHGMTAPPWAHNLISRPDPGRPSPAPHVRASARDPTPPVQRQDAVP